MNWYAASHCLSFFLSFFLCLSFPVEGQKSWYLAIILQRRIAGTEYQARQIPREDRMVSFNSTRKGSFLVVPWMRKGVFLFKKKENPWLQSSSTPSSKIDIIVFFYSVFLIGRRTFVVIFSGHLLSVRYKKKPLIPSPLWIRVFFRATQSQSYLSC